MKDRTFVTDDWGGYHRVVPPDQLFTGKDLTFLLEGDNSEVRHRLARFRRRTKVVSKKEIMVDLSLRLLHHLQIEENFTAYVNKFLGIFA